MNVLFVCTGNTCRSPMAEGLFKKITEENTEDSEKFNIFSGGINAADGVCANENAILALKEYDVDISNHISKNADAQTIADADIILTMTQLHKEALLYFFGGAAEEKTYTLLEYAGLSGDIDDPYGADLDTYKACAKKIYEALLKAFEVIRGEFDV